MALVLSGSIDISGSMTATTILISSPGAAGMVSSSAQITELAPLMAYTASLKGAAIVSSSQQITNYYKFAETASANTFYGNQSISGTLTATTSTTGAAIKLGGFTNYGTIQDVNDVRRIWFENVGSYRTIFDLPASGTSFAFRTNDGTSLFNVNSGSGASVGTGDLTITNGNLVMGTSGKGIDFSATANSSGTMTSELLNDYEEGTWTIGLTFGGASAGLTFSGNTGTYTKIGRQVTVNGFAALSNKGSSAGDAKITGLPFTIPNNDSNYSALSLRFDGVSYTGQFQGYGVINSTTLNLEEITEAGSRGGIANTDFTNSSAVLFTFTYFV